MYFATATCAGLTGLAAPDVFAGIVRLMQTSPAIYAAAVVRVAVRIVLLRATSASRLPIFLRILGGFVLLGGLLTPFVGKQFALGLVTAYAVAPKPRNA